MIRLTRAWVCGLAAGAAMLGAALPAHALYYIPIACRQVAGPGPDAVPGAHEHARSNPRHAWQLCLVFDREPQSYVATSEVVKSPGDICRYRSWKFLVKRSGAAPDAAAMKEMLADEAVPAQYLAMARGGKCPPRSPARYATASRKLSDTELKAIGALLSTAGPAHGVRAAQEDIGHITVKRTILGLWSSYEVGLGPGEGAAAIVVNMQKVFGIMFISGVYYPLY